jgi:hypothetical protein
VLEDETMDARILMPACAAMLLMLSSPGKGYTITP